MKEQYHRWYSQELGKEISMLTFGEHGMPVILFPTSMGMHNENKDFGLVDTARWFVDNGLIKIYCPDSIDRDSWYNKAVPPQVRVHNHICYDKMLYNELVPWALSDTGAEKVATAGCSFGAYHATNFGFKHPDKTAYIFCMGGAFDIKPQLDGYYAEDVYFNNPPDFIANAAEADLWNLKVVLGTSDRDFCKPANEQMHHLLQNKGIHSYLDIRPFADHDWPVWREMFPQYLAGMFN